MTLKEAEWEAKMQAVTCGGVSTIKTPEGNKQLTGQSGFWFLDGVKVEPDERWEKVLQYVEVDSGYVQSLVTEDTKTCPKCGCEL